ALRDPRMRFVLIIPPLLQTIIFGYAVSLDVEHVRLGWMDLDRSPRSEQLRKRFEGSPYFDIARLAQSEADVERIMDRGDAQALVRIPAGYGAAIESGRQAGVQVLVDGANSNTAAIIANYAAGVIGAENQELMETLSLRKLVGRTADGPIRVTMPSVKAATRVWFNPELKSRNYFVPGIIVNIITLVTLMLTALSVVREKEIGTMEQIMVTPIRPIELMLGKTIPFLIVGFIDMALVIAIALELFHVPLRGSLLLILGTSLLFMMTTLGAGLLLSTVSETQQQAMMGAFFFFQPAFMLSGFAFPLRNMPEVIQWLTYLNPLRYFMDIVRGVFLKGTGVAILWPQILALAVFGFAILFLSALRFQKRLD
ncbi:MAG: ABC transporter permease, partial [Bryobacterales bacterium]|nr:ABC transporter permease [Bryobacterales bacterium]